MFEPVSASGRKALASAVADPADVLLAVDFDGTLAPIVDDPAAARVHPEAPGILAALAVDVGGIAVVTGRPAADAVRFGQFDDIPELVVVGHYGLERWHAGELRAVDGVDTVDPVRADLQQLVGELGDPGVGCEDKGRSVAVHTRRAARSADALAWLRPRVQDLADQAGLEVVPGRDVLEIRPVGVDKGTALAGLIEEFGPRTVVYVGDDLGDLPAMRMVHHGTDGTGLVVVSSSAGVDQRVLDTADITVDGPAGLVEWLSWLLGQWSARPSATEDDGVQRGAGVR